jgi:hypothetical protein
VVGDGDRVEPVGIEAGRVVDVDELRMIRHDAEVRFRGVEALDEVIPDVPLPHDVPAGCPHRFHLDDVLRPHPVRVDHRGVTPVRDRVRLRLRFPGEQQDVSVRQRLDVVMLPHQTVGVDELPQQVAVPIAPLHGPAPASEHRVEERIRTANEVPVLEDVGHVAGVHRPGPRMAQEPVVVDQIGVRVAKRLEERVAVERTGQIEEETHRLLRTCPRGGSEKDQATEDDRGSSRAHRCDR